MRVLSLQNCDLNVVSSGGHIHPQLRIEMLLVWYEAVYCANGMSCLSIKN